MPWCDTDAMAAHLIEISAAVDPGAQAVLIVDAGWHLTPKLAIPDNITVLALPPRSPRVEPGGECLAIHAQTQDHVRAIRHAQMGAWVLINDRWYNYRTRM